MQRSFPDVKEPELRGHLSSFGVQQTLAGQVRPAAGRLNDEEARF
jgi:hypothetical protein